MCVEVGFELGTFHDAAVGTQLSSFDVRVCEHFEDCDS